MDDLTFYKRCAILFTVIGFLALVAGAKVVAAISMIVAIGILMWIEDDC